MQVLITRPEEDARKLAARLTARGFSVTCFPLLQIVIRVCDIPRANWQAVLATSANGIRAAADRDEIKSLRTLTVGPQSLAAAKAAGFTQVEAHGGDVEGLAAYVAANLNPQDGPLLYLSGAETSGDLEGRLAVLGFACHRAILYDAVPASDAASLAPPLARSDAVLLYSPRSARIWCDLIAEGGLVAAAARPSYLCLSMNVAKQLPAGWRSAVAKTPDEDAMLALLEQSRAKL